MKLSSVGNIRRTLILYKKFWVTLSTNGKIFSCRSCDFIVQSHQQLMPSLPFHHNKASEALGSSRQSDFSRSRALVNPSGGCWMLFWSMGWIKVNSDWKRQQGGVPEKKPADWKVYHIGRVLFNLWKQCCRHFLTMPHNASLSERSV